MDAGQPVMQPASAGPPQKAVSLRGRLAKGGFVMARTGPSVMRPSSRRIQRGCSSLPHGACATASVHLHAPPCTCTPRQSFDLGIRLSPMSAIQATTATSCRAASGWPRRAHASRGRHARVAGDRRRVSC
eukprot:365658-Chlamydomonas_euryale.AAC.5